VGYVGVVPTARSSARSRRTYLLAAVLWLAAAAFSVVRLVMTIADPDRETSPVASVVIVVLFAAAAAVWFVQYRRNRSVDSDGRG
jgi:hypothetical protein